MPIKKVKDGYKIDNVDRVMKTREEAEKRLKAIKTKQSSLLEDDLDDRVGKELKTASRRPNFARKKGKA